MTRDTFVSRENLTAELNTLLDEAVRLETISNLLAGSIPVDATSDDVDVKYLELTNRRIARSFARREAIRQVLTLREQAERLESRLAKSRKVASQAAAVSPELYEAVEAVRKTELEHYARVIGELAQAEEVLRGEA